MALIASRVLHRLFEATLRPQRRVIHNTTIFHRQQKTNKEEEDMDELQKNPYFAKYADKIAKMQK